MEDWKAGLRAELRAIEIATGEGLDFCHYPGTVVEVVAVETELHLGGSSKTSPTTPRRRLPSSTAADAPPAVNDSFDAGACARPVLGCRHTHRVHGGSKSLAPGRRAAVLGARHRSQPTVRARFQRRVSLIHPYVAGASMPRTLRKVSC